VTALDVSLNYLFNKSTVDKCFEVLLHRSVFMPSLNCWFHKFLFIHPLNCLLYTYSLYGFESICYITMLLIRSINLFINLLSVRV
jgi:hypothetical protein